MEVYNNKMGNRRRIASNKQRGMNRKLRTGKKPMNSEEKEARKVLSEKHREMSRKDLEGKKK